MQKNPKKHSKNRNRRIYYVNSAPGLRNDQKSPKKRITQSQFAQIVLSAWHILDNSWWILMSTRFRICLAKGGRGCLRPSYKQPKLTLIKKKWKLQCCKKMFWNRVCPLKSRLPIGYGKSDFIGWALFRKLWKLHSFATPHIDANG